jgi:hypothetical protein
LAPIADQHLSEPPIGGINFDLTMSRPPAAELSLRHPTTSGSTPAGRQVLAPASRTARQFEPAGEMIIAISKYQRARHFREDSLNSASHRKQPSRGRT